MGYMDQHGGRYWPFKCYVMPWGDGVYGSAQISITNVYNVISVTMWWGYPISRIKTLHNT